MPHPDRAGATAARFRAKRAGTYARREKLAMRLMLLGALLLAATGLAPPRPASPPRHMFLSRGIPVEPPAPGVRADPPAPSAVAAREQAIASGEREALRHLLRRLTLPEDAAHPPPVE